MDLLDRHLNRDNDIFSAQNGHHTSKNSPMFPCDIYYSRIDYKQNLMTTYNLLEAMRKSPHCKKMIELIHTTKSKNL